ncbi:hypothetical protein [Saccharothrix yanglingensis]|uniref:hypothetical protein n=1 Tax=Saccharothrix yanglingensis TaxID=659496 RepID=UPI0027D2964B|nr:hypothetical protein [Saccharothrix yanglingensis]
MTATAANDLFSHPEAHTTQQRSGPRDDAQRTYTDLFREPDDAPEGTPRTGLTP